MRLSVILIALILSVLGCKQKIKDERTTAKDATGYYTCSMHPQVKEMQPGACPICGMKLIHIETNGATVINTVVLNDEQIQLGNIRVDTIKASMLGDHFVVTGTLNFDQSKVVAQSAKVMGRIEHLYFKNIGDYVKKGDKLFDIYSEELNNAKQEYISAKERKALLGKGVVDFDRLIESARTKLKLWGMSDQQIDRLSNNVSPVTSFYSDHSGYITSLDVKEGAYIDEGGSIVQLAELSTLWVEAQVYASQLSAIDRNASVAVTIPDMPDKKINSRVSFINPEINADTRIDLIRVVVPNFSNELKPGMPAIVQINNTVSKRIVLPLNAVLRDAGGASIWVRTDTHTFMPRRVEVGLETGDVIEIKSGLHTGDVVVTSGAYLLNSEYIFKHGNNPMEGHDMSKM
ncbi:MAG: efflux RND transporter periplasmic adaptor subunit [Bacteroidota bacterium]|nr:efflux RND transporter periplasmic adaptor subunit [Bacteroidota bacterium]